MFRDFVSSLMIQKLLVVYELVVYEMFIIEISDIIYDNAAR